MALGVWAISSVFSSHVSPNTAPGSGDEPTAVGVVQVFQGEFDLGPNDIDQQAGWVSFQWFRSGGATVERTYDLLTGKPGQQVGSAGVRSGSYSLTADRSTSGGRYQNGGYLHRDTNYTWRARLVAYDIELFQTAVRNSSYQYVKTQADSPTGSVDSFGSVTQTSIHVNFSALGRVVESTATAQLQRSTDQVSWSNVGSAHSLTGYTAGSFSDTASGLTAGTTYYFRVLVARTTSNVTSWTSAVVSQATAAANVPPTVTTNSPSTVGLTGAELSGSVVLNNAATLANFFTYGTDPVLVGGTRVAATSNPSGAGATAVILSGVLTASTTYYCRAETDYTISGGSPGTALGSIVSFSTLASAEEARIMPSNYNFRRTINEATHVQFALEVPSGTNSDRLLSSLPTLAAGDVQVSIDGAAFANSAHLPTYLGGRTFDLELDAAEVNGERINIVVADQTATCEWRDILLQIETSMRTAVTGSLSGSVASVTGNVAGRVVGAAIRESALTSVGASTAGLDAGASAVDDYYNGCILVVRSAAGTEHQLITDYVGSTKVATVGQPWVGTVDATAPFSILPGARGWDEAEGAQPPAGWAAGYTFRRILQLMARRLFNHQIMTAGSPGDLIVYKDGSTSVVLLQRDVSDDGSTQTQTQMTS